MTSLSWKSFAEKKITKYLSSHLNFGRYYFFFFLSFFKGQFYCGMVKQRTFLHVVDLSFDAIFVKFYHNECPIKKYQNKMFGNWLKCIWYFFNMFFTDSLWEDSWFHHSGHVTLTFDNHSEFHRWMRID